MYIYQLLKYVSPTQLSKYSLLRAQVLNEKLYRLTFGIAGFAFNHSFIYNTYRNVRLLIHSCICVRAFVHTQLEQNCKRQFL